MAGNADCRGVAAIAVPVAEWLDAAPVTRRHWHLTFVIGLGLFFDLYDVFLAGALSTVLTKSFALSPAILPMVLGSSFLGMFFGAIFMGAAADRIGRRPAFLLNLGIYSLFTLAGAFSPNARFLIVTRFLAGIGIGAQMPLSDAYLSEILFVAGSLGGIVVWAMERPVVESPRWLEATGRVREAHAAAAWLLGQPVEAIGPALPPHRERQEGTSYRALFAPGIRRRTLMLYVFQIFQTIGYYGFGTMVPLVLAHKGFTVLASLTYTTIAFLGYPLGAALSLVVIERIDRRLLIILSALAMAAFGLALGFAVSPFLMGTLGILYTLVSNIFSNSFHILQSEIFPTAIRGRAAGSAYGLSRLSSAAMPFVLLPVLTDYGAPAMFAIVAAAMAIVIADIAVFAPRTTGRKLDQIAAER